MEPLYLTPLVPLSLFKERGKQGERFFTMLFPITLYESLQRAIVRSLHFRREKTSREFLHPPMIIDAFTADPLPAAWLIRTVASLHVFLFVAHSLFHVFSSTGSL
jgi:hypothetical protein